MQEVSSYDLLLRKYLQGTISFTERQQLFSMTESGNYDSCLKTAVDEWMHHGWKEVAFRMGDELEERIYLNIKNKIFPVDSSNQNQANRKIKQWRALLTYAAVTAVILFTVLWLLPYTSMNNSHSSRADNTWLSYLNAADTVRKVFLQDSTFVQLWPGAQLRCRFSEQNHLRQVELKGSAEFEVKHRKNQPFVVRNHELEITVLGTRFLVNEQHANSAVDITVRLGKVGIRALRQDSGKNPGNCSEPIMLLPNHKVAYNVKTGTIYCTLADEIFPLPPENENLQVNFKTLDFGKGITLEKLLHQLERTFGVKIEARSPVPLQSVMVGNYSQMELHKILEIICLSANAVYAIEGEKVVLMKNIAI